MKDFVKISSVSEVLTAENENPNTGKKDHYVRSRWSPLCERGNEIDGGSSNAFRRLWKRDYSDKEWDLIIQAKAIAQGNTKLRDIVPQKFEGTNGKEQTRRNILLCVFHGESDEQARNAASYGENKAVFLPDKQEESLVTNVELVEEEKLAHDTDETVSELLQVEMA